MKSSLVRAQQNAHIRYRDSNIKQRKPLKPKSYRRLDLIELRNKHQSDPFYQSDAWRGLRYRVLVQRGRRCQLCGATGLERQYHVDHIKPRSKYPHLALSMENLQVLCQDCNLGKGAWDETDWRKK